MNKERLQLCVVIMLRVEPDRFYAKYFQSSEHQIVRDDYAKTFDEFQARELSASFAGYLALSPEFHETGGTVSPMGTPHYQKHDGIGAVCRWLDCDWSTARALVTSLLVVDSKNKIIATLYNKSIDDVTVTDVLNYLKTLGEVNVPL